jgi:hypothetical protein
MQPAAKDFIFGEFKEFDGQRMPTKIQVLQNGRRIEEWTSESYRFPSKIEDREFIKP